MLGYIFAFLIISTVLRLTYSLGRRHGYTDRQLDFLIDQARNVEAPLRPTPRPDAPPPPTGTH